MLPQKLCEPLSSYFLILLTHRKSPGYNSVCNSTWSITGGKSLFHHVVTSMYMGKERQTIISSVATIGCYIQQFEDKAGPYQSITILFYGAGALENAHALFAF